jgi:hypothetical protein
MAPASQEMISAWMAWPMAERVAARDGRLRAGPRPGRFRGLRPRSPARRTLLIPTPAVQNVPAISEEKA